MGASWNGKVSRTIFQVTEPFTSDLVFRIISLLLFGEIIPSLDGVCMYLRMTKCRVLFLGNCDFDL